MNDEVFVGFVIGIVFGIVASCIIAWNTAISIATISSGNEFVIDNSVYSCSKVYNLKEGKK